jgi:hypothetical protein
MRRHPPKPSQFQQFRTSRPENSRTPALFANKLLIDMELQASGRFFTTNAVINLEPTERLIKPFYSQVFHNLLGLIANNG